MNQQHDMKKKLIAGGGMYSNDSGLNKHFVLVDLNEQKKYMG